METLAGIQLEDSLGPAVLLAHAAGAILVILTTGVVIGVLIGRYT